MYDGFRTVPVLQEPTFLILTALAAQPLHEYGIIPSVTKLSHGDVTLRPGTLYGALDRLTSSKSTTKKPSTAGCAATAIGGILLTAGAAAIARPGPAPAPQPATTA